MVQEKIGPTGPLTIYVAWHPDCPDGAFLAKAVYEWFRKPSTAVERSGAGIPVYYRCRPMADSASEIREAGSQDQDPSPETAERSCSPQRPIEYEHAEINVVIPLIDEHLVNDPDWRQWLYEVAELHRQSLPHSPRKEDDGDLEERRGQGGRVLMVPVQLHSSISRLAPVVSAINAVRLDRWDDEDRGLDTEQASAQRRTRRAQRIRRFLVQTLVRELRLRRNPLKTDLLPRSVFLSHAKGDRASGVGVAEKIRAEALHQGQIDTFFDTTDLDWGAHWQDPMESSAGERTAAFIAIFGDLYATRFWCREEIRRARHPRKISAVDRSDSAERRHEAGPDGVTTSGEGWALERIWWVQPTVIVDTLGQGWSRLLPEMSGTPIVRWRDEPEAIAEILDRVLLEALRAEIQARHAFLLAKRTGRRYRLDPNGPELEVHFLTWVPDPYTLMEWAYPAGEHRAATSDEKGVESAQRPGGQERPREQSLVIYPGHGLAQSDELRLQDYWRESVQFMSVEELAMEFRNPDRRPAPDVGESERLQLAQVPMVALSVGDPDLDELYALGYGPEHLDDAVYRLATALIGARARLSYGGVLLRTQTSEFLVSVLDAAGMMFSGPEHHGAPKPPEAQPETFVHSYQAWDFYRKTGVATRADLHGLCTFHDIRAEHLPDNRAQQEFSENERALWQARSLSAMRRAIAEDSQAMVALGGKPYDWIGFAPGVVEQICLMHRAGKPVLVLSSFGGAARRIVSWFQEPSDSSLDWLHLDHHLDHPRNESLREVHSALVDDLGEVEARRHLEQRYGGLAETLVDLKSSLLEVLEGRSSYAGLNSDELEQLMTTSSVSQIRHLLTQKVVSHLLSLG